MSNRFAIVIALLGAMPGVYLRLTHTEIGTIPDTVLFGLSIVSSAFLLSWAAEASEVEIAQGLAVAFIALIAVLPEYAVDMTFAWKAAQDPEFAPYAVANMTGGNRLLIGGAWPAIFLVFWWRSRQKVLHLERAHAVEIAALAAATLFSLTLPLKDSITLIDTAILAALFILYVWVIARAPSEEPELVGPALFIGTLPRMQRRGAIIALFLASAGSIFASAEPFAEGLVHTGTKLGIDEFVLVQWLAPFASEAPEFLVAGILAYRGRATVAMGALLSSKVNQWTLLIGGLPIAYAVSGGHVEGLPLDLRQKEELFLTAAQSYFALAVVMSLSLSGREAIALAVLFFLQFAIPVESIRMAIGVTYMVLGTILLFRERSDILRVLRISRAGIRDPKTLGEPLEGHSEAGAPT
ncbi:MAG: sodium:calcium antiporter [Dehalococcoidia bacterium]|nr:sodium:calcium antiporter [Dehalococcoidia bacterium]MCA9856791.1 sodium:calcium antiporter [Dehalococcoidia bacterium]MCB9482498.1 sodium:calcium antiporter [Dehalococcoidia bacterium]MCB9491314.1 sodium:calcium antiporter [Dehalococcoidia bacterium]